MNSDAKKKLQHIVFKEMPTQLMLAHDALDIYLTIAENSEVFNQTEYAHLMGVIQIQAFSSFVLSTCTIFEAPKKGRLPNFSIHVALQLLDDVLRQGELQVVPGSSQEKIEGFIKSKIDANFSMFERDAERGAIHLIHKYFKDRCLCIGPNSNYSDTELGTTLEALKVQRDKRIAHFEDCPVEKLAPQTDINRAIGLLCFAKTFINIIGYGFLGCSDDFISQPKEFYLCTSKSGYQLKRLIEDLLNRRGNVENEVRESCIQE